MATTSSVPVPSDSESHKQTQIMTAFPTLLEKTEKQAAILLGIVNRLGEHVYYTEDDEAVVMPEEIRKKAQETTLMALHQLDNIMEDMKRWNAEGCPLEKTYTRYLSTATDLADSHLIRTRQDTMPHVRYKAKLYRVDINDWIACFVQGRDEHAIGRGPTAYDALADFDRHFLKGFDPKSLPSLQAEEEPKPKRRSSPRKALKK